MSEHILKGDARLPLYQRLADELKQEIVSGQRKPGERIPSENVMSNDYGIAAGTVRQALSQLVAEGMLERIRGRGTYVKRPDFNQTLLRFFRFRSVSGELVVPESHILERSVKPAPNNVARHLKIKKGDNVIYMRRLRLVDGFPTVAEQIWLSESNFSNFMNIPTEQVGELLYPVYESQCNQLVVQAEELLSADLADAETAELLQVEIKTPVMVIERLAKNYGGEPLEWRQSKGCADQFQYHMEIR